ncbi:MFS transporter [Allostella sp. ATCC 35155]|nr:MFS transporter [Stella sp. ATCC 35155]
MPAPVSLAVKANVALLALCQALSMTATNVIMVVTGLVGLSLADDKSLATVPLGLQFTAMMLSTLPSAFVMKRFGRRAGFTIGSATGMVGAAIAAWAILHASFWGFAAGSFVIGFANGVAQLYRFAAADAAPESFRSRAISLVMAGGIVSASFGPEFAKWSRDLLAPVTFAGCFVVVGGLHFAAIIVQRFLTIPTPTRAERQDQGRPLSVIARQPTFVVAVLGGMVGYAVMSLVMTSTPIAMAACNLPFEDSALVIQWHALGMYVPAFFTGHLIHRFGVINVMLAGIALNVACVAINLSGIDLFHFWTGLLLLGVGWNFVFVGATTLLTRTHTQAERAKVQSLNDFLVFGLVTVASFSSGALLQNIGWAAVNIGVAPLLVAVLAAVLWLRARQPALA